MSEVTVTTLLISAIEEKNLEVVSFLLRHGVNVNSRTAVGSTPLHVAATLENAEILKVLLQSNGVNVNIKDGRKTALQMQLKEYNCNFECMKVLLDHGANVFSKDDFGNTLLHLAVMECDVPMVEYLLDRGIDVNCQGRDKGSTPLNNLQLFSANKNWLGLVKLLLERNADPNIKDRHGMTPFLHLMVQRPDSEMVALFIAYGADVTVKSKDEGKTAMHHALYGRNLDNVGVLQMLLKQGLDVDCRNDELRTPFFEATRYLNPKIMKFLVKTGADVNAVDDGGRTALLDLVFEISWDEEKGYGRQAQNLYLEVFGFLMRHVDVNINDSRGCNVLSVCDFIPDWCWKIVIENLVIRIELGKPVGPHIHKTISGNSKMHAHYVKCKNELEKGKKVMIYSDVNCRDIIVGDEQYFLKLKQQRKSMGSSVAKDYKTEFPIYAEYLELVLADTIKS